MRCLPSYPPFGTLKTTTTRLSLICDTMPQPVFTMPYEVRCPLHGTIALSSQELALLDHPVLQRLRHISQLGLASMVYPGATHSRFSHVMGAMHLAGTLMDQLAANSPPLQALPQSSLSYARKILRLAALLHDTGHAPFSHSFEPLFPPRSQLQWPRLAREWLPETTLTDSQDARHEEFSVMLVAEMTENHPELISAEEAQDVCALLDTRIAPSPQLQGTGGQPSLFPLMQQAISGEIDVDRMDYLRRDAHYAGVSYGFFDLPRLIGALEAVETENGFVMALDDNAVHTYEHFLLARFHMTMQVYFHKTLLGFDACLHQVMRNQEIPFAVSGDPSAFLQGTEHTVWEMLQKAAQTPATHPWSTRIVQRNPLTRLLRLGDFEPETQPQVLELLSRHGIEVIQVQRKRRLSSLGLAGSPLSPLVRVAHQGRPRLVPLEDASKLLQHYNQNFGYQDLYCDAAQAQKAQALLERLIPSL